jgi:drug/metabolite transporter (DMT)-like permease
MPTEGALSALLPAPKRASAADRALEVKSHAALIIAAAISSGFNVVLSQTLHGGVSPLAFAAVRDAAALILLYAWAVAVEGPLQWPAREHRTAFLALGLLLGAFQMCFAGGVALTDADTAALFQCIEPTTAALMAALLQQERLTISKSFSALFAGSGVLLIQLTSLNHAVTNLNHTVTNFNHTVTNLNLAASASSDTSGSGGGGSGGGGGGGTLAYTVGCALLFGQGIGIVGFCLIQKRLVRTTAPITARTTAPNTTLTTASTYTHPGVDSHPCVEPITSPITIPSPITITCGSGGGRGSGGSSSSSHGAVLSVCSTDGHAPETAPNGIPLYGPVTVTAHAYLISLATISAAVIVDISLHLESPSPISAEGVNDLFTPLALCAVAYAVILVSCVGNCL